MKRSRYSRIKVRTAIKGLAIAVAFWAVCLALTVPFGARWPEGFPEINIERNQLSPFLNGQPHPPVHQDAQPEWEAWVWFATLVAAVTFLWVKCWMMKHFTARWGGLEKSIFVVNALFLVIYLRSLSAMLYPTFLDEIHFWRWAQRGNVWLLIGALVWGVFQMMLIEDQE